MAAIGVCSGDKMNSSVKVGEQRQEIVMLNVGGKRFAVVVAFVYIPI